MAMMAGSAELLRDDPRKTSPRSCSVVQLVRSDGAQPGGQHDQMGKMTAPISAAIAVKLQPAVRTPPARAAEAGQFRRWWWRWWRNSPPRRRSNRPHWDGERESAGGAMAINGGEDAPRYRVCAVRQIPLQCDTGVRGVIVNVCIARILTRAPVGSTTWISLNWISRGFRGGEQCLDQGSGQLGTSAPAANLTNCAWALAPGAVRSERHAHECNRDKECDPPHHASTSSSGFAPWTPYDRLEAATAMTPAPRPTTPTMIRQCLEGAPCRPSFLSF